MVPRGAPGPLWRGRVLGSLVRCLLGQSLALDPLALRPLPPLAAHLPLLALALALATSLGLALAATVALPMALARGLGAPLGDLAHLALGVAPLVALVVLALVVGLGLVGSLVVLATLVVVV